MCALFVRRQIMLCLRGIARGVLDFIQPPNSPPANVNKLKAGVFPGGWGLGLAILLSASWTALKMCECEQYPFYISPASF